MSSSFLPPNHLVAPESPRFCPFQGDEHSWQRDNLLSEQMPNDGMTYKFRTRATHTEVQMHVQILARVASSRTTRALLSKRAIGEGDGAFGRREDSIQAMQSGDSSKEIARNKLNLPVICEFRGSFPNNFTEGIFG